MRSWTTLVATVAVATTLAGTAGADSGTPDTTLSPDRFAVLAGAADAPVQLELFCDPQCPECTKFESASGAALGRGLASGKVAVTYRWLTFLDARRHNDTSARVGTALVNAADPTTPATAYQRFVENLYRSGGNPATAAITATARAAGIGEPAVERIESGQFVDTIAMNVINRERLKQVNPENPGTPTVYDLNSNTVVDTGDAGWLDRLLGR